MVAVLCTHCLLVLECFHTVLYVLIIQLQIAQPIVVHATMMDQILNALKQDVLDTLAANLMEPVKVSPLLFSQCSIMQYDLLSFHA